MLRTTSQAKISVCMQASREMSGTCTHYGTICPSVYGSLVRHQVLRDVTQHFNRPFGNRPGFEHRRVTHKKLFRRSSIIIATLIFGESSPLNELNNLIIIIIRSPSPRVLVCNSSSVHACMCGALPALCHGGTTSLFEHRLCSFEIPACDLT